MVGGRWSRCGAGLFPEALLETGDMFVVRQTSYAQKFRSEDSLIEHRDQCVLDRNVFVFELARLLFCARQHTAEALSGIDLPAIGAAAGYVRNFGEFSAELAAHRVAIDTSKLQNRRGQAFVVFEERSKQMLDVDG